MKLEWVGIGSVLIPFAGGHAGHEAKLGSIQKHKKHCFILDERKTSVFKQTPFQSNLNLGESVRSTP